MSGGHYPLKRCTCGLRPQLCRDGEQLFYWCPACEVEAAPAESAELAKENWNKETEERK